MIKVALVAAVALAPVAWFALAPGDASAPSPAEIAASAPPGDWIDIPESELLLMETAEGGRVVIQMASEFAPVHVGNIRKIAAARWWDGTSINRVQDNYVVQWGDATERKTLPEGVIAKPAAEYFRPVKGLSPDWIDWPDPYAKRTGFWKGWPVGGDGDNIWLTHCYGMVGVGRNLAPDTGSGAELYAVIGHAPRHLDRNIALVGRVIEGMEFLASRPRGTGDLGFYTDGQQRIAIGSIKPMSDAEAGAKSRYQYLSSKSFSAYRDARANRRDPFFNVPAGGADVCNIPVPIRRAS
ncbi:peptidylprolyl isomerase [Sphingomonas sp. LaA6.9]|uniref:peptidylprolyl isomerase n=1 Tax=Sphingomonas sp. LaA6.9 TaxID=2919914 RepID=UPI001F4FE555|nr:peptidylprolyl isomerase [Sphingomonas sp. LaA6.9]MCJ8158778.1 peptidylprolyl isomerase [Sphingomonas sp. LaA6.9]